MESTAEQDSGESTLKFRWRSSSVDEDVSKSAEELDHLCLQPLRSDAVVATVPKKQKGRKGKKLRLITNYVRVVVDHPEAVHEYNVKFFPRVDNLEIRKQFIGKYGDDVLGPVRLYDGTALFLPKKLSEKPVLIEGMHPKVKDARQIAWIFHERVRPGRELVGFFNILFRRVMTAIGTTEHRKTFLNKDVKVDLPTHKLQVWPGICTSVEEQETGLLLMMDTSYRVFRTDTVYDYYCALRDTPDAKSQFMNYIVGKVVVTQYNNFTYRVDDVDWDRSISSSFECNGKQMSYSEYVKEQYNATGLDDSQPLLLSRIKVFRGHKETDQIKIVSIIPQLCFVAGMDQEQWNDPKVTKDLKRHTFTSPTQRINALSGFLTRLKGIPEAQEIFKEWNCTLEDKLLNVEGREIQGPHLKFGNAKVLQHPGFDFTEQASASNCYVPIPVKKWLIICTEKDKAASQKFIEHYIKECSSVGIQVSFRAEIGVLRGVSPEDFREALEEYANPELVDFVIVMMPISRQEIYSTVKRVCVGRLGIPSQVVLSRTLSNPAVYKQVIKSLASQINCKLGGSPWGLIIPVNEQIMLVGIDVYHDVRKLNPSVVALAATLNNSCTQYFTKTNFQRVHQEITDNMKPLFMEILDAYHGANGIYPERIVIFRDGGNMAGVDLLTEHEVKPMLSAIQELCPNLKHFNYVLVSKRIPQRFYTTTSNGNTVNPCLGTIIDSTVTYPNMFDFYVVSQQLDVGCVQPTHYMAISDIGSTPPDFLQKLAFSTAFMFFNWPGVIRVPAMIQYAHKVSSLVGRHLKMDPSNSLANSLYFL